jgi:hypothetical protein
MRGAVIVLLTVGITTLIGFFGLTGIVAPIAKAALLLVPAIFTMSLIIGFALRRQHWFR